MKPYSGPNQSWSNADPESNRDLLCIEMLGMHENFCESFIERSAIGRQNLVSLLIHAIPFARAVLEMTSALKAASLLNPRSIPARHVASPHREILWGNLWLASGYAQGPQPLGGE